MPRYSIIEEELVFKLIKEVKKREWLYNTDTNPPLIDKCTILKSWAEIAAEIGKPEDIVKRKWKSLRDVFWKEVKRCGGPDTYTGKWRFYNHVKFIYQFSKKPEEHDLDNGEPEYLDEEAETVSNFIKSEKGNMKTVYSEDPLKKDASGFCHTPRKRRHSDEYKSQSEDFDVMFLNSLTPYFKQLDPIRKLVVRSKIQDMLLSEISAQSNGNKKKS